MLIFVWYNLLYMGKKIEKEKPIEYIQLTIQDAIDSIEKENLEKEGQINESSQ